MNIKKVVIIGAVFLALLILGMGVLEAARRRWNFNPVAQIAAMLTPDSAVVAGEV